MSLRSIEQERLPKPGPIGRAVRLLLGIVCLYALAELILFAPIYVSRPIELFPNLAPMILIALCLFSYVVNSGFGKNFRKYPTIIFATLVFVVAIIGFLTTGNASSTLLGTFILIWLGYFYAHLGISFVLASILGTPGCEMRSIPDLLGKISGKEAQTHQCIAPFISGLDRWEARNRSRNKD